MVYLLVLLCALIGVSCSPGPGVVPRAEHPRPDFQRAQWLNLNGEWEFRFDPADQGIDEGWQKEHTPFNRVITVPFCWESKLSGIEETAGQQIGWYRREIDVPSSWDGRRIWLRFEAVDWEAQVWVDGAFVGKHEGGYTPFAIDISGQVDPGDSATVVVRAYDPTDAELPTGKQVARWYTFTSGIWQTVWLEARPATWVEALRMTPVSQNGEWSLEVEADLAGAGGSASVRVSSPDETVAAAEGDANLTEGRGNYRAELRVTSPKLWTPETPHLYDLTLEVTGPDGQIDAVKTYFGLRTISREAYGGQPYESILLNGEPVYLRGALDQSFNPDGIHTAPSDEFLRRDMEIAKSVGLNFLRIHIKPDEPRRLYWADKLGVLIMQDMPCTWTYSEKARAAWESTMRGVIDRDRNHPSIFSWVLFNESWGLISRADPRLNVESSPEIQEWVKTVWEEVKHSDPSRLVEDNSPNKQDHVITDINSWHFYTGDFEQAKSLVEEVVRETYPGSKFNYADGHRQTAAPLINSEYGAVGASAGDRDISWGFRSLTTLLRRHEKIQGYVYTELSDIEFEHNGFVNYDRSPKEYGYDAFVEGMTVADLQREDFVGFDTPPVIEAEPGEEIKIPVFVSHWSDTAGEVLLKRWLIGHDDLGREVRVELDSKPVTWERYRVTGQQPLEVTLPDRPFAGAMAMELVDEGGNRLAANFVNIIVGASDRTPTNRLPPQTTEVEALDARRVALRTSARNYASARWRGSGALARLRQNRYADKFTMIGAGSVEYRFDVPEEVIEAGPDGLALLMELSTKAVLERMDWPQEVTPEDYPQTDGRKFGGAANIIINGNALEPIELLDDPADSRGVLSHFVRVDHGSYGYLVKGNIFLQGLPEFVPQLKRRPEIRVIIEVPEGEQASGLTVHGALSGRYPLHPTVVLETQRDIVWPGGQP